jgi:hypothetical protein
MESMMKKKSQKPVKKKQTTKKKSNKHTIKGGMQTANECCGSPAAPG